MPRMRSRTVHPEFFTDADLYQAEQASDLPLRLAFEGLWCAADRERRFKWKPAELKLAILPYDPVDFEKVLEALLRAGLIVRYEVEGKPYGLVVNLLRYQHIHKDEASSKLPPPPETVSNQSSQSPETPSNLDKSPGIAGNRDKSLEISPTSTTTSESTSTTTETLSAPGGATNGAAGKHSKPARPPPGLPNWVNEAVEIYAKHIGVVPHGKVGKLLKPLVDKRGWSEVLEVLQCFCELAPYDDYLTRLEANTLRPGEEKAKKFGYHTTLAAFVERYTHWHSYLQVER